MKRQNKLSVDTLCQHTLKAGILEDQVQARIWIRIRVQVQVPWQLVFLAYSL